MKVSDEMLMHYGILRRSGRYPWGSGENPYQHSGDFYNRVQQLRKDGFSDTEIAKTMDISTTQLRAYYAIAKDERRANLIATAKSLRDDGLNNSEIGRKMGINESSVRSLLNEKSEARTNQARNIAEFLKKQIDEKGMIDVGSGVEIELGDISREKFDQALEILQAEGYPIYPRSIPQVTNPNQVTNMLIACKPGTEHKDIYVDTANIKSITEYTSKDGGETFETFQYPSSLDSKRIMVRYAEEGGLSKDGVVELRRGIEDISLGESTYAQVRILVDGTHFIKGMAIYSDDSEFPPGVDVIFNTNKSEGTPMEKVLKPIKTSDPDNPFGSYIKANGQREYIDADGNKQLSVINKVREEGDWDVWDKNLAAQMLSKQNLSLVKKQLNLTYADKLSEFDEIKSLTNPTLKKRLLLEFADDCDGAAVNLKTVAFPGQSTKVILPSNDMKPNEIYAPTYKDGQRVALIRYPHGGTFEIPELTVNNRNAKAKDLFGNIRDAVGINSKVAERLSGADFDGDTVIVIPITDKVKITSTPRFPELIGFDPKTAYPYKEGMRVMKNTQMEMGKVSNLITDMTLKGADSAEIAKAVKHSMVVIDAEKHKLNYKQSEIDNDIAGLRKKYMGHTNEEGNYSEGASTLISRSKAEIQVPKTKGSARIDPVTGEKTYKLANETYIDPKTGKTKLRMQSSTRMAQTKDAYSLVSEYKHPIEMAYANYANKMKAMANEARKEAMATPRLKYSKQAANTFAKEVASLTAQLTNSKLNAPKERQAQAIATSKAKAKKEANPSMTKDDYRKIKNQELAKARVKVGAKSTKIVISDNEWKAIQSGAISDSKLSKILAKTDTAELKKRAMPKQTKSLSSAKQAKIRAMKASGYTIAEIASSLGISSSTVSKYV